MAEQVELVGVEQAQADLQRWVLQLPAEIQRRTTQFAQQIQTEVAGKVPVLTGRLQASVVTEPEDNANIVGLGENVPYAGWIEFGGARGRPLVPEGRYLYPTVLQLQPEFVDAVEAATTESINAYPWSTPTV